jgi:Sortase domain
VGRLAGRAALTGLVAGLGLASCATPPAPAANSGAMAPKPQAVAPDPAAGRGAGAAAPAESTAAAPALAPRRAAGFEIGPPPAHLALPGRSAPPVQLIIPDIGLAAPLDRLGLDPAGGMEVPADFQRAGWYARGPSPGQLGPAVLAGHVDSRTGPAVFARLRELGPGDAVQVELADGTRADFVVEGSARYPKATFPTVAVFGPVPYAALRLVTCDGVFDPTRRSYHDNLVVTARLVPSAPPRPPADGLG